MILELVVMVEVLEIRMLQLWVGSDIVTKERSFPLELYIVCVGKMRGIGRRACCDRRWIEFDVET